MSTVDAGEAAQDRERTLLRGAGLRVTQPRLAVLTVLRDHQHSDATAILNAVRRTSPSVSHQAVYDCLHALTEAGLVRSIQPAGSPARYEIRRNDNHHHLVCRGCGDVVDIPCQTGPAPCLHTDDDHGYAIDEAEVYFWGLCPACQAGRATGSTEFPTQSHTDREDQK
ncbi:transcriptional repressor [Kocuria sp. JC486]|uniref:Fur family transcriptional regulator n=1 Tax=Kocuria sp. JC486 TaxID=1970736 RepID=UPI0014238F19|nr:Fur family transcriptional regulator [Kocuria sp. JC486]NHU85907.1 transcriptional repressor [Kocuria sp. JC486]